MKLGIIKSYRIATKRIGELKQAIANTQTEEDLILFRANLTTYRAKKHSLAALAQEQGFKIWTNDNGRTGHTYEKDYKETPAEDNDWTSYCIQHNMTPEIITPNVPTIQQGITAQIEEHNSEVTLEENLDYDSGEE